MSETRPFVRSRFRAPDGRLILRGPVEGEQAMHVLLSKDETVAGGPSSVPIEPERRPSRSLPSGKWSR